MEKRSAFITGAGGFIGSHLTERLLALGWQLTTTTLSLEDISPEVKGILERTDCRQGQLPDILRGDILQREFDYIFHLAGSASVPESVDKPVVDFERNTQLTLDLLELVRTSKKHPRIIYISSAAVYGNPQRMPITEETPFAPLSPYGVSKLASDQYMRVFAEIYSLPTVVLRPFSVYGERQRKLVIHDLIEQLKQPSQTLQVRGDGTQSRDFVHITDLVDAIVVIAEKAQFKGEAYNVASGCSTTIRQLVELLVKTSGEQRRIEFSGATAAGEPLNWEVDISKLRALGFSPKVELAEGLRRLVKPPVHTT